MDTPSAAAKPVWYKNLTRYDAMDLRRAIWQLVNTFVPFVLLWVVMVLLLDNGYSYWLVLPLIVINAGLMVRIFIFFHDAVHGSFFESPLANKVLGYVSGILTFTPYEEWRRSHSAHHAMCGDLDRRGVGDVWTMTMQEYRDATPWQRFFYRFYRFPPVMFGLGPTYMFMIMHRLPSKGARKRDIWSVHLTTLGCVAMVVGMMFLVGWKTYLLIEVPMFVLSGAAGLWLFYVQHQFDGVYWARRGEWSYVRAGLEGSSYYKLPKILQWFTGNIGLHHIHHLRPRIPNYSLQRCYDEVPEVRAVKPITLLESLKCLRLRLYDEETKQMVGFRELRA
jgi:omega-6 fatty acid desaturase (delta-12 desaturase)